MNKETYLSFRCRIEAGELDAADDSKFEAFAKELIVAKELGLLSEQQAGAIWLFHLQRSGIPGIVIPHQWEEA